VVGDEENPPGSLEEPRYLILCYLVNMQIHND
jgi:hypothetical protein